MPNQDAHLVLHLRPGLLLAAIFDGHGPHGHSVACRVRDAFAQRANAYRAACVDRDGNGPRNVLTQAFHQIHESLCRDPALDTRFSGTTATVALVDAFTGSATVAHVGDSTLMLCTGTEVNFVTKDHIVDDEASQKVLRCGGEVRVETCSGIKARRIAGLNMCRSLGDESAHSIGVTCTPDVSTVAFLPGSNLVICSDGVWDQMTKEEVAGHLATKMDTKELDCRYSAQRRVDLLSRSLVLQSKSTWLNKQMADIDDITALVVEVLPAESVDRYSMLMGA
jgi:serine/threonine protein phosphatase PrpC